MMQQGGKFWLSFFRQCYKAKSDRRGVLAVAHLLEDRFMTHLVPIVNKDGTVSSKLVAEKFGKQHQHVLRDLRHLVSKLPKDFSDVHFCTVDVQKGLKESQEYFMSRDGFSLLAMGFTGKAALAWKVRFLEAFNQMEQKLLSELPQLRAENSRLKQERLSLPPPKKTHHLKDTIPVMQCQQALWGGDISVKITREKKDDDRFSQKSRDEGKIAHFSACIAGMSKAILEITKKDSIERRK
jgi:Rha family phage regulatory protein